ncbi:MAG: hypothetical protein PUJ80_02655 [Verrucomicrobiota bacterium]|nr:hypothetical protein [Verrucomicrobiota bacterium]
MIYGRELPGYPYDLKAKVTRCIVAGQRILFGNLLSGVSDHAMLPVDLTGSEANDAIYELLIGAGAYGMSIGAYVKRELGKKALHLGGIKQLLFGIKGRRWDARPKYTNGLYNDAWSRPLDAERPQNFMQIESGGYW